MSVVSMNYLLEAGVHFGHQKRRWNPKMGEYIFTSRDDIYIIDLQKTVKMVETAYNEVKKIAENGGTFLYVGTKKQAQEAMQENAERVDMFYMTQRWLGGTLTNFRTIKKRIKRLDDIEKMEEDGIFDLLPKKEVLKIRKEYDKLNNNLSGIRKMHKLPSALILVDPRTEETAIKEARKLKIPIIGLVDTNCDPDMVDFVIPANDDAIRSVKLIIGVLTNAIAEVNGKEIVNYVSNKEQTRRPRPENNRFERRPEAPAAPVAKVETPTEVKVETIIEAKPVAKAEVKPVVKAEVKPEMKKATVKKAPAKKADLSSKTLTELKALAKEKSLKGYSTLKKADLLELLNK